MRLVDQPVGDHSPDPERSERDPGRAGEDRTGGNACADRTTASEHSAKAHQRRAGHCAAHIGLAFKALKPEFLGHNRRKKRADKNARNQPDIEFQNGVAI